MENEIWKTYPEFDFIKVSNLGRVRTLDRVISTKKGMRVVKGHILKQYDNGQGYLQVVFSVNYKTVHRKVHRLVAQTFIQNPNSWPEVNHKDNNPSNNMPSNLEWCTRQYNVAYREKYGISAKEATKVLNRPVYAVNLKTLEISRFESQREASRELGIDQGNITNVITGRYKTAGGFWFVNDDGDGFKIDKNKLREIKAGMPFRGDLFAISLSTQEASRFKTQTEAGRELGVNQGNISEVIKGHRNQTHGYWFTNADENAVESTRAKFGDEIADKVEQLVNEKELQPA